MIHYTKWFLPEAKMYNLESGCGFTASRLMLALRMAVRAAKEHSNSMFEHLYNYECLLLALYEFDAIDFETYEHGMFRVKDLIIKIHVRNKYKEVF